MVELNAQTMTPMHFGTFRLSYEPLDEPPQRLMEHAASRHLASRICLLSEGEPRVF